MNDSWKSGDLALCVESGHKTREGTIYTVSDVHQPGTTTAEGYTNSKSFPYLEFMEIVRAIDEASDARRFRKIRPDAAEPCEAEFSVLLKLSKHRVHCDGVGR